MQKTINFSASAARVAPAPARVANDAATRQQIAKTILAQLGGSRFVAMTGANQFVALESGLQFYLPRTRHFVRDGINVVRVILELSDTYTVEFLKVSRNGLNSSTVATCDDVYADNLQHVVSTYTGLDTHL